MGAERQGKKGASPDTRLQRLIEDSAPVLQQMSEGVIIADLDGRLRFVNDAAARLHGVKQLMVAPDGYSETYGLLTLDGEPYPNEDLPLALAVQHRQYIEGARWRIRRPDRSEIVAIGSARPLLVDDRQVGALLTLRDDSKRFTAEQRLRESEERLRLVQSAGGIGTFDYDLQKDDAVCSPEYYALFGLPVGAPINRATWQAVIHPDDQGEAIEALNRSIAERAAFNYEYRIVRADTGELRWLAGRAAILFDDADQPWRYVGGNIDITARKQAEALGAVQSELLELAISDVPLGEALDALVQAVEGRSRSGALASVLLLDDSGEHLLHGAAPSLPPAYCEAIDGIAIGDGVGSCGTAAHRGESVVVRDIATDPLWADFRDLALEHGLKSCWSTPIRAADGAVLGTFAIYYRAARHPAPEDRDLIEVVTRTASLIIERKQAEQALKDRSDEFYALADNIPALAWMAYADGDIFWYNRRWYEYTGTSEDDQKGWGWESVHDPDMLPAVEAQWRAALATGHPFEMTFPLRGDDGALRPFLTRAVPIRDDEGRITRWFGTNVDITDQVAAEQALQLLNATLETRVEEEVARRTEAEEALRQSQKMETLGQLTGGIAHDFNNLLQIIAGNLDILRRNLPAESARLSRSVDNAMKGADRAAVLTQRLLAFSRRQPLAPKVIDANKLVAGMSEMLHRTLGENYAVETVLASGLWRVEADPNQLESALLNLAVNGRDAMPAGGKLTIETANAHLDHAHTEIHGGALPGQYVLLCVSDTGAGMDRDTAERAVEPFFTTKEVGKGTGLGLSMVYGFVKQSGGHLDISSESGEGTTVKIYLPRHFGSESAADEPRSVERVPEGDSTATILVCEDDADVRSLSAESLRELGYRVIEAEDGEAALALIEGGAAADLLFTDVVLPGMTGAVLAQRARALRPTLKVLFTTGYARNAIVHHGRLDPGVELISKPFTYADLAVRVRDLLDSPAPASARS